MAQRHNADRHAAPGFKPPPGRCHRHMAHHALAEQAQQQIGRKQHDRALHPRHDEAGQRQSGNGNHRCRARPHAVHDLAEFQQDQRAGRGGQRIDKAQ